MEVPMKMLILISAVSILLQNASFASGYDRFDYKDAKSSSKTSIPVDEIEKKARKYCKENTDQCVEIASKVFFFVPKSVIEKGIDAWIN